jgi:hypothetical protein
LSDKDQFVQYIRIPVTLLNQLCQVAAAAPVPYAQSQAMWKAIEQLRPEPEPEAKADEPV